MNSRYLPTIAVLTLLALAGCADGGPRGASDTQSFLGISQDIQAVFQNQNRYLDPLRANE